MSVGRARGRTGSVSPGVARAGTDDRAALERRRRTSHLALWALTLTPAAVTLVHAFTGGLGFNPIETLTHRTGWWAIVLLVLTLAVTPLRRLTGWHWLVRYRRQLGLATFVYASLHLGVYAFLDLGLDLSHLGEDVLKRPFITVGFTAWLVLLALAVTSTQGWIRRLGRRWAALHRLVYVAAGLVSLHFVWGRKTIQAEPLVFAAAFAALLAARAVFAWRRRRRSAAPRSAPAKSPAARRAS